MAQAFCDFALVFYGQLVHVLSWTKVRIKYINAFHYIILSSSSLLKCASVGWWKIRCAAAFLGLYSNLNFLFILLIVSAYYSQPSSNKQLGIYYILYTISYHTYTMTWKFSSSLIFTKNIPALQHIGPAAKFLCIFFWTWCLLRPNICSSPSQSFGFSMFPICVLWPF